ncbi:mucolipin-3 isoform X1 [Octopus bimaculoides]|nr:mucolipin-3 isoform X1 [Octopus bimaculoides]|eukprot:XP_014776211.1 PREDICTED: mucolipin-3-like isoform X2 [Octopus bimaculoides]
MELESFERNGSFQESFRGPEPNLAKELHDDMPVFIIRNMAGNIGYEDGHPNINSSGHAKPPLRRQPSYYTPDMEDRMRRRLKFFFMDPIEKLRAKKRIPWKMLLQVVKVILVTIQLCIFGLERGNFVDYVEKNTISLKHLFLKDWEPAYETLPYPPATGTYAVYEISSVFEHIDFVSNQYSKMNHIAIGGYHFWNHNASTIPTVSMCKTNYYSGSYFPNGTFIFNPRLIRTCANVTQVDFGNGTVKFDFKEFLKRKNIRLSLDRLLKIELNFLVHTVRLELDVPHRCPICFLMNVSITFDNSDRNGQMLVFLNPNISEIGCRGSIIGLNETEKKRVQTAFDIFIIIVSTMSSILCLRSIWRAQSLKKETAKFFKNHFRKVLEWYDRLEFLNMWFILIVINDCLTIVGSCFKIKIETRNVPNTSQNYDLCAIMLGTGNLLSWIGVLRYLGFFKKYNILILTLKRAAPNVLRFLTCALLMYFGFVFCGWVILGPYHIKFRHLSTTSECLFSLVNGDDMFVTFSALQTSNSFIWFYSRVYLYCFIGIFIYVVLSLFIAVIMDSYETIKHYYENGFPRSELFEFIDECTDPPHSEIYRQELRGWDCSTVFCFCCKNRNPEELEESTRLIG